MTPSQLQNSASDPTVSAWVAASAGSGKTKVLTDRVLRLLLAGNDSSKILCLTYTRNAAAEMQNRIAKKLSDWATISDEELSNQLKNIDSDDEHSRIEARKLFAKMLDTPDGLKIMTIHSFCQSLLKRFPIEAGVSPEFQVMDELRTADFIEQARIEVLSDPSMSETLNHIANYCSEDKFKETINEITGHLPDFSNFFQSSSEAQRRSLYEKAFSLPRNTTFETLTDNYFKKMDSNTIEKCINDLESSSSKTSVERGFYLEQFFNDHSKILEYGCLAFLTSEEKKRKNLTTKDVEHLEEDLKNEQDRFYDYYQQIKSLNLIDANLDILKVGEAICQKYIRLKRETSQMDYDDLIHKTLGLLNNPDSVAWVMYKLDKGIDHILVDEAQDTSPVQWKIIQALTSEFFSGNGANEKHRTLFVVGDKKQSIYSFQGAEPDKFTEMQKEFQEKVEHACFKWRNVPMNTSFRSAPGIIHSVNELLQIPEMQQGVVELGQELKKYEHSAFREGEGGQVELFDPFIREKQTELDSYEAPATTLQKEKTPIIQAAEAVAEKIKELIEQEHRLPNGNQICPRDIMVLVRRRDNFVDALTRELKARNIPVSGSDRLCITQHIAVEDLMSLGDFVLLPSDELTLATILRSPLCNLTEIELYDICIDRNKPLFYSLKDKAKADPNSKYNQVFQFLNTMLDKAGTFSPFEFYSYVLQLKMKDFVARLGIQVIDPLEEFLNKTLEYDYENMPSLQLFLRDLRNQETFIKRDFETGINEVRIMTVHASKGMEAPVIFLPDTCRYTYKRNNIQWGDNLPIWLPTKDFETIHSKKVNEIQKEKALEEYHRLLYVAVTRASDQLYIYGYAGVNGKTTGCWYSLLEQMLEKHTDETGHKIYIEQITNKKDSQTENVSRESNEVELPVWIQINAPKEDPLSKPLAPSRQKNKTQYKSPLKIDNQATKRGTLIHKMLEVLPNYEKDQQGEVAQKLLKLYRYEGNENLVDYVLKILQDKKFYPLFTPQSQSEVPITGITDEGQVVSGVIDRLAVSETEVLIVDYKSNQNVPPEGHIPVNYMEQVKLYAELVQKIYPNKKIRPFIMWTDEARLDEVFL